MNVKNNFFITQDFIFIENLEIACRVGTTAEERAFPQVIFLSLKLFLSLSRAGQSDDLGDTLDYATIIEQIKNLLEKSEYQLVETIAERTANLVLKHSAIEAVEASVGKKIFTGIERVGVQIFRTRSQHGETK